MMGNCHVRFKGEGKEVILVLAKATCFGDSLNLTRLHLCSTWQNLEEVD